MSEQSEKFEILELTTEIVSSYLANNSVEAAEIPDVIDSVFKALSNASVETAVVEVDRPEPAVPINKSVMPDYIVCLEDGKQFKMLKRHLKTVYNMTPNDYRERWGLPADYPMVSPNYAAKRSLLAKNIGLGKRD